MRQNEHGRAEDLIERYLLGSSSQAECDQLSQMLIDDAALRDRFRRAARIETELRHVASQHDSINPSTRGDRKAFWLTNRLFWPALAASVLIAGGIAYRRMGSAKSIASDPTIANASDLSGNVRIVGSDGQSREAVVGDRVLSRETIRLSGETALARVTYPDTTELVLVNNTAATLTHDLAKQVAVHRGTLVAHVAKQPSDQPMMLTTSQARVDVLGTELLLTATERSTDLAVEKGTVRVTRARDAMSVIVDGGNRVVSDDSRELRVSRWQGAPAEMSIDFEDGSLDRWEAEFVSVDLPVGSYGAIRPVYVARRKAYMINSPQQWTDGHFTISPDTHVHIVFKVENPDWVNIFSLTRNRGYGTIFYICKAGLFHLAKPNVWYKMTLPISTWQRHDSADDHGPPHAGEIVYQFTLSYVRNDRGLVVDRIWVTRGGPGAVEMKPLEIVE